MQEFSADAAFRRYFRLAKGGETRVLMHAPDPSERSHWFVALARYIRTLGLSAPQIYDEEVEKGFILLEDLGSVQYFDALENRQEGVEEAVLYREATDVLAALHAAPMPTKLGEVAIERYDDDRLIKEAETLLEWHWPELKEGRASDAVRASHQSAWHAVLPAAHYDADRLVQLDYHSPNLMWLPNRDGVQRVGILDFQDAMRGPSSYDLVSLLKDARRDIGSGLEESLIQHYLEQRPDLDEARFRASYAVMGAQRAARILGVFPRLWRRDGKPEYLRHIPRLWRHLDDNLMHPVCAPLRAWYDEHLPPQVRRDLAEMAARESQ
ncbi:MAG: phosphotransferase [Pacificimonas sp.]|nr:phosphotransferase [Pacificimonas sp.]